MVLLFKSTIDRAELWVPAIQRHLPDIEVRVYPDTGDLSEIEYALVWKPPQGFLAQLPNLKAIFSLGAGIDHLASDPDLPAGVPVVRMVERGLTAGMTEFVVMQVLYHHRRMLDYRAQQARCEWRELPFTTPWERRVGIMGLGVLGSDAAAKLAALRFDVLGWSRSPKQLEGVTCFHGREQFDDFVSQCDILVCLLPLTEETRGILDGRLFAKLPRGASVINVGRGGHLVDQDLLSALASGQLDSVTLDVFHEEPLPADHPYWEHPRIIITPHVASITIPDTAAESLARNIRRIAQGVPPENVVDLAKGY